jgi:hypothetical protein
MMVWCEGHQVDYVLGLAKNLLMFPVFNWA